MATLLIVPIHIDALYLKGDKQVVEQQIDFTRLPYKNSDNNAKNSDTINISENIVSQPFQNTNLLLKAGIHLHWALPDALTVKQEDREHFPTVPNRWLVSRSTKNTDSEKMWVVESDYLFKPAQRDNKQTSKISPGGNDEYVSIPYKGNPPFRFLGRTRSFDEWKRLPDPDPQQEYLSPLTAIGYGTPAFAAFYPNCHSVFGFKDTEIGTTLPEGLRYDVVGWYSNSSDDYFGTEFKLMKSAIEKDESLSGEKRIEAIINAVKERFHWTFNQDQSAGLPEAILCYGSLTFQPEPDKENRIEKPVQVTLGNTGTEALSARLAELLRKDDPSITEEQIEAYNLASFLENNQLDLDAKFDEARHTMGFTAHNGGSLWTVSQITNSSNPADARSETIDQCFDLPQNIITSLTGLNALQAEYDRKSFEIESLRFQLFSDWYKYMRCVYNHKSDMPEKYDVREFIEERDIKVLKEAIESTGELRVSSSFDGEIIGADSTQTDCLSENLSISITKIVDEINEYNRSIVETTKLQLILKRTPAPRFWEPREPVVLITGDAAAPSDRYGSDGRFNKENLLECKLLAGSCDVKSHIRDGKEFVRKLSSLFDPNPEKCIASRIWKGQPWHPLFLEWEVNIFPLKSRYSSQGGNDVEYRKNFITENFELKPDKKDLSLKKDKGATEANPRVYIGTSILTPQASFNLKERIESCTKRQGQLDEYFANKSSSEQEEKRTLQHLNETAEETLPNKSLQKHLRIYKAVNNLNALSQCLGGFNKALLMHKQTYQLEIGDPLGSDDDKKFALTVNKLLEKQTGDAPQPQNVFIPIRNGEMEILQLRLIDTFGESKQIDNFSMVCSETLPKSEITGKIPLPPRIVQPSRLNFTWLAADVNGSGEYDIPPVTTPVCGWIIPNNLDNSLMIYDARGKMLGYIDRKSEWKSAPGQNNPAEITNQHLLRMKNFLTSAGMATIPDFIRILDTALENIDPEGFTAHQDLALLMGRPLALVRASVKLELKGLPVSNQGWQQFTQSLEPEKREHDNFTSVQFPVRIGESSLYNDGLVGYWLENDDGSFKDETFHILRSTEESEKGTYEKIRLRAEDPFDFQLSFDSQPKVITMLIDPRCSVHATCGILPVKSIRIPQDLYGPALRAMEVTFLTSPVLTSKKNIDIALPSEPGFDWFWLQKEADSGWTEIPDRLLINKIQFFAVLKKPETELPEVNCDKIWENLLAANWIKPYGDKESPAEVVPPDKRKTKIAPDLDGLEETIQAVIEKCQYGIRPPKPEAEFTGAVVLREGWLKLKPQNSQEQKEDWK